MKIINITITAISIILFAGIANAEHKGVVHYEGQEVKNSGQAFKVLHSKISLISNILIKKKLSDQDLEKIHEISYSLETASDKLIEEYSNNSEVDSIGEAVQALHFSSENHKEAETRKWFKQLSDSAKKLKL